MDKRIVVGDTLNIVASKIKTKNIKPTYEVKSFTKLDRGNLCVNSVYYDIEVYTKENKIPRPYNLVEKLDKSGNVISSKKKLTNDNVFMVSIVNQISNTDREAFRIVLINRQKNRTKIGLPNIKPEEYEEVYDSIKVKSFDHLCKSKQYL